MKLKRSARGCSGASQFAPVLDARPALGQKGLPCGLQIDFIQGREEQACDIGLAISPMLDLPVQLLPNVIQLVIFEFR